MEIRELIATTLEAANVKKSIGASEMEAIITALKMEILEECKRAYPGNAE